MISWLGLYNLGFASGLLNHISGDFAAGRKAAIRQTLSTAFALFTAFAALVALTAILLPASSNFDRLFGLKYDPSLRSTARNIVIISGLALAANMALNVVTSMCTAFQESYLVSAATTIATLASVSLLGVMWSFRQSNLTTFALTQTVPVVLATGVLGAYCFLKRHPDIRPTYKLVSISLAKEIARPSLLIFVSQIGDMLIHYSTNLVVASSFGPAQVPRYAVPYSMFMIAQSTAYNILQPLWPAYSEAFARGD